MRRSRLTKKTEKKTKESIALSVLGIIIVIFLIYKFGLEMLINFSLFVSGSKNQQSNTTQNEITFVAPPVLDPISQATNSAQVIITGKADKDRSIYLYINNSEVDQTTTDNKGTFTFKDDLSKGSNQIYVKAKYKNKESDPSNTISVTYANSQPKLELSTPSDGQQFKKDQNTANVTGKTDSGISITVNGFWAVIDENNNFSYNLPLTNGDNQIKIIATDQAGNKSEKEIKVSYSQ